MSKLGQRLIASAKEARDSVRLDLEIAEMQRDIELAKKIQKTRALAEGYGAKPEIVEKIIERYKTTNT